MMLRLIAVPVVISLGVTVARLIGEIAGASDVWFDPWGPRPGRPWESGVVGIGWLALPSGAYFGWRLAKRGDGPSSRTRAGLIALAILFVLYLGRFLVHFDIVGIRAYLRLEWGMMFAAAALLWLAWPALARTVAVYGVLARLQVAIVMFFALRAGWGTHYDFQGVDLSRDPSFWLRYLQLALVPQLVHCVVFTLVAGIAAGSLTVAVLRPARAVSGRV